MTTPIPTGLDLATVSASFVRPANVTAYAANQLIANDTVAANVKPLVFDFSTFGLPGSVMTVNGVRVRIPGQTTSITTGLTLYLFNAPPVPSVGDGGALVSGSSLATTGETTFMGPTGLINAPVILSDGFFTFSNASSPSVSLAPGSSLIYALLVASGAWTPSVNSQTITVELLMRP